MNKNKRILFYSQKKKGMENVVFFKHPGRYLFTGKSGSGKTTLAIKVISNLYAKNKKKKTATIDRIIVVCPTYWEQDIFEPIREFVNPHRDVFLQLNGDTITQILEEIQNQYHICSESGLPPIETLVLIDDMGGNKALHGGRHGSFPNFCLQSRHYHTSLFVVTQQAKSVTPAFRDNLEGVIIYPSLRKNEIDWAYEEYGMTLKKDSFVRLLKKAWKGPGKNDDSEWGQHFLFILLGLRTKPRFFVDFTHELSKRKSELPFD